MRTTDDNATQRGASDGARDDEEVMRMTQRTTTDGTTRLEIVNELMKRRRWCTTGRHFETNRGSTKTGTASGKVAVIHAWPHLRKEKRCQQKLGDGPGVAPAEEVQSVVAQTTTTKTAAAKKYKSWANKTEALPDAEPLSSSRALAITPALPIIAGGTLTTKGERRAAASRPANHHRRHADDHGAGVR